MGRHFLQFYYLFQLQVSSLLSNVFKLLMTHKVRSLAELSLCSSQAGGEVSGEADGWPQGREKYSSYMRSRFLETFLVPLH